MYCSLVPKCQQGIMVCCSKYTTRGTKRGREGGGVCGSVEENEREQRTGRQYSVSFNSASSRLHIGTGPHKNFTIPPGRGKEFSI